MIFKLWSCLAGVFLLAAGGAVAAEKFPPIKLDLLADIPKNWELTPDEFEKYFNQQHQGVFVWLTKERTRGKLSRNLFTNGTIELTLFDEKIPVEEVIVDFVAEKLSMVTFSVYNRADAEPITPADFTNRYQITGKAMSSRLGGRAVPRAAERQQGLLTEGFSWESPAGVGLLETNEGAAKGNDVEFLRLRIARPDAEGTLAATLKSTRGAASIRLSELPSNVIKDAEGNVFISNMPMVDQGNKGYCLPASTQRVFEYYGIGADMHQIAQVAGSDPLQGSNVISMAKALDKIDFRFKTRLIIIGMTDDDGQLTQVESRKGEYFVGKPIEERSFLKSIRSLIDEGIPLLWALELGKVVEDPNLLPQTSGGHMRLIIGYNDKSETIIFTDSWGAGHEFKTMKQSDAYRVSMGVFALKPTLR